MWQEQLWLCAFGGAGTAPLSRLGRSPTDGRTHEEVAGTAGFPINLQCCLQARRRQECSRLQWLGSAMLTQSQGSPPLHIRDSLQPAGVGLQVTSQLKRQETSTLALGHLSFGFSPIHHSGISHCCPSTCAVPSTNAFKHPPAMAPGWHAKKQGLGSLRYPREYPVTSIYSQPSAFLPTSSLQSRISQSSAFVQSTRLVLQTESTEPAMDLYFSVCIWTPKSLSMEADVQPEPWDSK